MENSVKSLKETVTEVFQICSKKKLQINAENDLKVL